MLQQDQISGLQQMVTYRIAYTLTGSQIYFRLSYSEKRVISMAYRKWLLVKQHIHSHRHKFTLG